ncbi:Armadillo-type fold [Phytophthora cactorum]|nr:Armadillo-type fold [Phytophthora cactorum]
MIPLLQRYRDAFNKVLQYPVWTHKCFYGLKAVALMGSTRVLESFGDQVPVGDVLKQLRWLFPLFKDESITAEEKSQRMNALLRPSCEFAAVALQTHVGVQQTIFSEVLPQLLELLIKEGDKQETAVAEAVKLELATTVAVLLEAKFPYTPPNTFALLPLPAFVEEMEADEAKLSASNAMFAPTAEAKSDGMETVDEEEEKASSVAVVKKLEEELDTRRMVSAQALAVMYRVIASGSVIDSVANSATSLTTPLDEMTKAAKGACSAIRHTLVEAFLSWLHHPDAANLLTSQVDFLHNVAGTLADPRVYGDVLAVLRVSTAISQLDRYSKSTANRIVSGLTRIAAACREDIHPLANELVLPLLPSMLDGSQWGKFLRLRTEAVATVLVGCAESDDFQMENHPWISDFISFLLDPVVSSENVHSFMILCGLIRTERKLLLHVVSFCMENPHTVTQTLHEPLARWPLYEEDVDLVVVTLELLEALLSVNTLRQSVDVDVIYATILQLSENAASEGLDVISSVCKRVIASLGSKH